MRKHLCVMLCLFVTVWARESLSALWFDGTHNHVITPVTINERGTQSCTLEAWVWPEVLGTARHVVSTDIGGQKWSIVQGANNHWRIFGGGSDVDTGFAVNTSQWQHVALTITAAGGTSSAKFYLNSSSFSSASVGFFTNYALPVAIGATPLTNGLFRGRVQEVRVWSYARQASQILATLTNAVRGTETGLVAYYRLNEGSGDWLYDQTTNARHARFAGLATNSWQAGVGMVEAPSFVSSYAGLWVGPAVITAVNQPYPTAPVTNMPWDVSTPTNAGSVFPMRLILHVDSNGYARLLQRAILVGLPTNVPVNRSDVVGGGAILTNRLVHYQLYADESRVPASATGAVYRISSTAFPVMSPALFSGWPRVEGEVVLRADDPVNPFVHVYHPDHNVSNNAMAVTRRISLTFLDSDPEGGSNPAWKVDEWGGVYEETITGLHQNPLYLKGLFRLQRSSREGQLR
jgi:hypothetical protein